MMPAWIGVALAAITLIEATKAAAQDSAAPKQPAAGGATTASPAEYDGWKVYHSYCDRCHGQDAIGSSFAPNVRQSVGANGMTESAFASVVADGRSDKGMPAFKTMVTDAQLGQLYAYVKARSAGTLGPGRPKRSS
jgi:cytochrome c